MNTKKTYICGIKVKKTYVWEMHAKRFRFGKRIAMAKKIFESQNRHV